MPTDGLEDLDLEVAEEVLETPDSGEAEEFGDVDFDARLRELGVDSEALEVMSEEAKAQMVPILEKRTGDFSRRTTELSAELNGLRKKAETYDVLIGSQEFQQFLQDRKQGGSVKPQPQDEEPVFENDLQAFQYHVKQAVADELQEMREMVDALLTDKAQNKLQTLRSSYEDWDELQPLVQRKMKQYPGMPPEEAYELVRAKTADDRALQTLRKRIEERQKANTLQGGTSGSVPKGLKGVDVSKLSEEEAFDRAAAAALARTSRGRE